MQGVKYSEERWAVDPVALRHVASQDAWTFECGSCEFTVSGSADGPEAYRLDWSKFVAARLDDFVREANGYLAAFVVPERFEASGPWMVECARFGCELDDPPSSFEMFLILDGDTYGLWSARFEFDGAPLGRYYPVKFSRQNQ